MIKFNKKLYLDEDNVAVTNRFIPFKAMMDMNIPLILEISLIKSHIFLVWIWEIYKIKDR